MLKSTVAFGFLFLFLVSAAVTAQEHVLIGRIRDLVTRLPVEGISVSYQEYLTLTGADGKFLLKIKTDSLLLSCSGLGYESANFPIRLNSEKKTDVGDLWLQPDRFREDDAENYLINPEDSDQDQDLDSGMPLLRGTRDVFLTRAAFDFSAGFYRIRGLDSRETTLIFNGLSMNRSYDGRPAWGNWAGLADISRNSAQTSGWTFSGAAFGGLLGVIDISASPSTLRKGTKLTTSWANKSYSFRSMFTYNSGIGKNDLGILISLVNRTGDSGYITGTPFVGNAGFAALQWVPNRNNALTLAGMLSYNRRGVASPLTEELYTLAGSRYNPHWGLFKGRLRNARVREGNEPYLSAMYTYKTENSSLKLAAGHQWGMQIRSRLASSNASNPDPSYYRNLPSYYYNSPLGANYQNTNWAQRAFKANSQIDWGALKQTNQNGERPAAYFILGDELAGTRSQLRGSGQRDIPNLGISLQGGFQFLIDRITSSGRLIDLIGGAFYEDKDPFNGTLNDVDGPLQKQVGDRVGYAYVLRSLEWESFLQAQWIKGPWEAGISSQFGSNSSNRTGLFRNERYLEQSKTKSPEVTNTIFGIKGYLGYRLSGHYWVFGYAGLISRPPMLQQLYVDPRENDRLFPLAQNPRHAGASLDVFVRYPWLNARFSGYLSESIGGRSLKSYYAETGYGNGFMREVTGDIATRHSGFESGMEFRCSPSVSLSLAAAWGSNTYINAPKTVLYYYPETERTERLPNSGVLEMGRAQLQGYHLSRGPERVGSIGVGYRDPGFWWLDLRANVMSRAYEDLAVLRYVDAFELNPDKGTSDPTAIPEWVNLLREQIPLHPQYHLNLSAGKSWMKHGHYISCFIGLNNLFNFIGPTGGFQQGRLATFSGLWDDLKSGHPSFGPKYWYGSGRTFFINLSWSF